jgi:hypothetical protein
MSTHSKSAGASSTPDTVGCEALSKAMLEQSDWWLKAETTLCDRLQAANARWLEHRRRDFDNGLAVLCALAVCRDFGDVATIQQKWLAECMHSVVTEWTDLMRPFAERSPTHPERVKETTISATKVPEQAAA